MINLAMQLKNLHKLQNHDKLKNKRIALSIRLIYTIKTQQKSPKNLASGEKKKQTWKLIREFTSTKKV